MGIEAKTIRMVCKDDPQQEFRVEIKQDDNGMVNLVTADGEYIGRSTEEALKDGEDEHNIYQIVDISLD